MPELSALASRIELDVRDAEKGLTSFQKSWRETEGSVKAGFAAGAGFGAFQAVLGGIEKGFDALKQSVFGMNSTLETSTAQFATLMGSADAAKRHVSGLFDYAKETPFETGPIVEASRMLETFGGTALNSQGNIRMLGDASAATGAPINELGFWVGRLYSQLQGGQPFGEAAMRLQELAVMSPQARAQMEALQKSGASADEIFKVFQGDLAKFTGATDLQAKSWAGLTATFTDSLNMLAADAMRPLFDLSKDLLGGLNAIIGSDAAAQWAQRFADALTAAIYAGRQLMATLAGLPMVSGWLSGLSGMFGQTGHAAAGATEQAKQLDMATALPKGQAGLVAAGGNLQALQGFARDAEGVIKGLDRQLHEVERSSREIKTTIDQTKRAFAEQTEPLERQLRTLKDRRDYQRDEQGLVQDLQLLEIKRAEEIARGDRTIRMRLDNQLRELDAVRDMVSLQQRREDIEERLRNPGGSPAEQKLKELNAQERLIRMQERGADLQKRLASGDKGAREELAAFQREQERFNLETEIAREREAADQKRAERQRQADMIELAAVNRRIQLGEQIDQQALSALNTARDQVQAQKDALSYTQDREKIESAIAALPLEQQLATLRSEQEAVLRPLQEQLDVLERQRDQLQGQKSDWSAIKDEIAASVALQKGVALPAPSGGPKGSIDAIKKEQEAQAAAVRQRGEELGASLTEGVRSFVLNNWGPLLGGAAGAALGLAFGPVGIAAGATLGKLIGGAVQDQLGPGWIDPAPLLAGVEQTFEQVREKGLVASLQEWTDQIAQWGADAWPAVRDSLLGFSAQLLAWGQREAATLATLAPTWVTSFTGWVPDVWPVALAGLESLVSNVLSWVGQQAITLTGAFVEWTTSVLSWTADVGPDLLSRLGSVAASVVEWSASKTAEFADAFGHWGLALVEWVGPKLPGLMAELGNLLATVTDWAITTGAPALVGKMAEWSAAITDWVAPRVPIVLGHLGSMLSQIGSWAAGTALPALGRWAGQWADALADWVTTRAIPSLMTNLGQLWNRVTAWLWNVQTSIWAEAGRIGTNLVQGVWQGIQSQTTWLASQLTRWATDTIPEPIRRALGIQSPSTEGAEIGQQIVAGIAVGLGEPAGLREMTTAAELLGSSVIGSVKAGVMAAWIGTEADLGLQGLFAGMGQQILTAIDTGMLAAVGQVGAGATEGAAAGVAGATGTGASMLLVPVGQQLMQGMLSGLMMGFGMGADGQDVQQQGGQETQQTVQTVLGWFQQTFGPEGTLATALLALQPQLALVSIGQQLAQGVKSGLEIGFFSVLGQAGPNMSEAATAALQAGVGQGGQQGGGQAQQQIVSIMDWFTQLLGPDGLLVTSLRALNPAGTLVPIGVDLMAGLMNGLMLGWLGGGEGAGGASGASAGAAAGAAMAAAGGAAIAGVLPWLKALPGQIVLALDSDEAPAIDVLYPVGWDFMSGLWNGAIDEWLIQSVWWGLIGYNIENAILMGGSLFIVEGTGKKVMQAFGRGVEDEWRMGPKLFFDRLGDDIRRSAESWPPDELLAPAGKKLMDGLQRAIENGSKTVLDKVRELGKQIKSAMEDAVEAFNDAADKANEAAGQIEASAARATAAAQQLQSAMLSVSSFSFGGGGGFSGVTGFAEGGILREPVVGYGLSSGRTYTFAEQGPEAIVPMGMRGSGLNGGAGGRSTTVINHYSPTIVVQGSVQAERDLVKSIRDELVRFQGRNVTTGLR